MGRLWQRGKLSEGDAGGRSNITRGISVKFGSITGKPKAKLLCRFIKRWKKLGNVKLNTFQPICVGLIGSSPKCEVGAEML